MTTDTALPSTRSSDASPTTPFTSSPSAPATASSTKQFTVGKVDAGLAVLLTDDHHLIEFPTLLLPKGVTSGTIVNIAVHRNSDEEARQQSEFWKLQRDILSTYGTDTPKAPVLRVKSATQTSVCLEWEPLELAGATLRNITVFRDNERLPLNVPVRSAQPAPAAPNALAPVPSPTSNATEPIRRASGGALAPLTSLALGGADHMVKVSGLAVDHEYTFHIVAKTSAGTYQSGRVKTRTQTMEDMSGIRVFFGNIEDMQQESHVDEEYDEEVEEEVEVEDEDANNAVQSEVEPSCLPLPESPTRGEPAPENPEGGAVEPKSRASEESQPKTDVNDSGEKSSADGRQSNEASRSPNDDGEIGDAGSSVTADPSETKGDVEESEGKPVTEAKKEKKKVKRVVTRKATRQKTVQIARIDALRTVLKQIGGAETETLTVETTHFVCDTPGGPDWDKATNANIPTVKADWLRACLSHKGKKIPAIGEFYISASQPAAGPK